MDILYSSAVELAEGIRARRVSAVEVVEAHLAQIQRYNAVLNAVVTLDAEGALARARAADAALARGEVWGPLHGVPFTLKDAFATAGMRTTTGFPPLAGFVPETDSTVAARLKAAGAILLGKSNVATLLGDYQTDNPIFGQTHNPWDIHRTPGGSSGGSAAALAAGMTPFEVGTDMSGSLRIPAHFCGLFGLKPTERRVSLEGVIPGLGAARSVRIMSCVGPMARTLEDVELLYAILAGPDGHDTEVPPLEGCDGMPEMDLKGLRVACAPGLGGLPAAMEIRAAVTDLGKQLSSLGAVVEEVAAPVADFQQELMKAGELIQMITGVFAPGDGRPPITLAQYMEALERRDHSIAAWEGFFEHWDVLLCPPCALTAFPHCETGSPLKIDGKETIYWMVSAHTTPFNYSGHPALVLPYRRDHDGLPLGVQLVARRWAEARLLGMGKAVARVTGGFVRPGGY